MFVVVSKLNTLALASNLNVKRKSGDGGVKELGMPFSIDISSFSFLT